MPQVQYDRKASYRSYRFTLVQHPDTQIIIFKRSIQEVLIATVDIHEQLFIKAEITSPNAIVVDLIAVHETPEKRVFYLDRFFDLTRIAGQ
jgi:hypothetical protein